MKSAHVDIFIEKDAVVISFFTLRLKLYFDHGEIKRYNGKRRISDLKAFVNKFLATSEVRYCVQYWWLFLRGAVTHVDFAVVGSNEFQVKLIST